MIWGKNEGFHDKIWSRGGEFESEVDEGGGIDHVAVGGVVGGGVRGHDVVRQTVGVLGRFYWNTIWGRSKFVF